MLPINKKQKKENNVISIFDFKLYHCHLPAINHFDQENVKENNNIKEFIKNLAVI